MASAEMDRADIHGVRHHLESSFQAETARMAASESERQLMMHDG
jgi:hypothetical protein